MMNFITNNMSLFITAKIVHILSAIFFIGVVSFRTFIMPILKKAYDDKTYKNIDSLLGLRARNFIKINNIFLIISGIYLLSLSIDNLSLFITIKAILGLLLAISFYFVPLIMKKYNYIPWFSPFYHYLFFTMMITVVILSQIMFQL